jgi:hypothetical protein
MKPAAARPLPGIFCQMSWGTQPSEARSFDAEVETVLAAADEQAPLPLYGFTLDAEPYRLARRSADGTSYRVYVPPQARVERSLAGDAFAPLPRESLPLEEGRPYVELGAGMALRFVEGHLRLLVQPAVDAPRFGHSRWRAAVVVVLAAAATVTLPLGFLLSRPTKEDADALSERAFERRRQWEASEKKRLEEGSPPSYTETDGGAPQDGRPRVTLPGGVRTQ